MTNDKYAKMMICHMCISNAKKLEDQSLYPVNELIARLHLGGVSEKAAKQLYDYVMMNEPYGAYITGGEDWDWKDDFFCLPAGYNETEFWIEELDRLKKEET